MRSIASRLAIAALVFAESIVAAGRADAAASALANVKPFRPIGIVNEQPSLCDPFLAGWTAVFDSDSQMFAEALDLRAIYPEARYFEVPETKDATFRRYAEGSSYDLLIDFDGDGDDEVLLFRSRYIGDYYSGVDVHLFDSAADAERGKGPDTEVPNQIYEYDSIDRARILKIGGGIYTLEGPRFLFTGGGRTAADVAVSLIELNAPAKPRTVCTVRLYPEAQDFAEALETLPYFVSARDVYGGDARCPTVSGPAAFDLALPKILYRPWTLKSLDDLGSLERTQFDPTGELKLLVWGLGDPQSWRDYLDVKKTRAAFLDELVRYYRANGLAASKAAAKEMAEQAWRFAIYSLANGHTPDSARYSHESPSQAVILPITSGMSPERIVRLAVDAWLAMRERGYKGDPYIWGMSWRGLMLAAIYTRQPAEIVLAIALKAEITVTDYARDEFWNQALIAALGHNELTLAILERAQPNYGNAFGKTALMYAAQHDRLNAVTLLLAHGASTDKRTDSGSNPFNCVRLTRDHRTALMYAAENASAKLIDALIDAGAEVAAKDTQGNTPLWYFSRNTMVTNAAERARLIKRLGG